MQQRFLEDQESRALTSHQPRSLPFVVSLLELAAGDSEKCFFVTLCSLLYDLSW